MPYVTPSNETAGNVIGATTWNTIVDDIKWLAADSPRCKAYLQADRNVGDTTGHIIGWDINAYDNSLMHSPAINNDIFTIPEDGLYQFTLNVSFSIPPSPCYGWAEIWFDNTYIPNRATFPIYSWAGGTAGGGGTSITVTELMSAGEFVRAQVYQFSGVTLQLQHGPVAGSGMEVRWVGPYS